MFKTFPGNYDYKVNLQYKLLNYVPRYRGLNNDAVPSEYLKEYLPTSAKNTSNECCAGIRKAKRKQVVAEFRVVKLKVELKIAFMQILISAETIMIQGK